MMGTASRRTTHRIRATGRTLFVLGATLILVAVLAPFVSAQGNSPAAECDGAENFLVKFDWNGNGWDIEPKGGDTTHAITISDVKFNDEDEPVSFDWSQGETTATVGFVVVFGGGSAETYGPGDKDDLTAPLNTNTKKNLTDTFAISHITFCAGETPTVVETPTPSETPTDTESERPNVVETPTETEEPTEPAPETVEPTEPDVLGVVIERPPAPGPAPEPDAVAEPEVLGSELPRTGPEDLWLAGLALMLMGAGLLVLARGRAMDAAVYATGTWWTNRAP